jgi:hypothetical protein
MCVHHLSSCYKLILRDCLHVFWKQAKYEDATPTVIDLFNKCNCWRKIGFVEPVNK